LNGDEDTLITELDALEAEVTTLAIRWWHLVFWRRSPLRTLALRFRRVEPGVRKATEELRARRDKNWQSMKSAEGIAPWVLVISAYLDLQDQETALSSRLERVRFVLLSKESEEHARRSVLLGTVSAILGVISLVLGALSLRH